MDAVLKVGGSLSRGAGLAVLCREIGRLGQGHRLLVVPGGGDFADQVRKACRHYDLDDTTAHCMALLAMDQYGYMISQLIPGSCLTSGLDSAFRAVKSGGVAILLPSAAVIRADPLPHSWQVTSDTIAAWVAHQADCRRLILLKSVDGLLSADHAENSGAKLIAELTVGQLAAHAGGVDEYLARFLVSTHLDIWIINGLHPERLSELLATTRTTGTRIRSAAIGK